MHPPVSIDHHASRAWPAWAVHAYTATGAVWAFLPAKSVVDENWRFAFFWLFVALLVDSTDGRFARLARVTNGYPTFRAPKLEDIIDYLTFVFVPALIVRADLVPVGWSLLSRLQCCCRAPMAAPVGSLVRQFVGSWVRRFVRFGGR